ncbi:hypothetical protein [Streptomyces sp. NPDC005970]|uniref:hypothetical protein n=1 Tax=Streptomyces sp. NPDC005970 TaxID=3156723 RepID=UPI0033F99A4E
MPRTTTRTSSPLPAATVGRKQKLAREEVPWIQDRMWHVERRWTAPGAAAPAVFHERLLSGLRRLLKARARVGSAG